LMEVEGLSLVQLDQLIQENFRGRTCFCGTPLEDMELCTYPHPHGYQLDGQSQPLWVYYKCPSCGYGWSLSKVLGGALRRQVEVVAR